MMARRARGERNRPYTSDLGSAFEGGKSDIEGLKEEIEEWKDNLENNNMSHLPKFEEVEEASNQLDTTCDQLDGIEVSDFLAELPANYTQDTRTSAQSRAGRLDNALNQLHAAKDAAEAWLDDNEALEATEPGEDDPEVDDNGDDVVTEAEVNERDEQRGAAEEFINELDGAIGEAENVSFPGMY